MLHNPTYIKYVLRFSETHVHFQESVLSFSCLGGLPTLGHGLLPAVHLLTYLTYLHTE